MHAILASANSTGRALAQAGMGSAVGWLVVMLVVAVGGAAALYTLRRKLLGSESEDESEGLTLHDLRRMHQRGDLTTEEFEAAKRVIIGTAAETAPRNPITGQPRQRRPRGQSPAPLQSNEENPPP